MRAFKKYTEIQLRKKAANEGARQEYFYWLGKRVFENLRQGVKQAKNQKMLYEQLEYDFKVKTATKCIQ